MQPKSNKILDLLTLQTMLTTSYLDIFTANKNKLSSSYLPYKLVCLPSKRKGLNISENP